MTIQMLKVVRSAEFHLHTYGKNHCGTANAFDLRYHMTCLCSPKLDHRGFLFDQLNIDVFFNKVKKTSMSCEKLTETLLKRLKTFILEENPACEIYAMNLTLSPHPYAVAMTSQWARDPEYVIAT
jgi:hypothetical protein